MSTTKRYTFWLEQLTATERARVWAVCNGETPSGVTVNITQRYRLASFRDVSLSAIQIPDPLAEATTVVNALESTGVISAGRAAEILANTPI